LALQETRRASPWPFLAMIAMAGCLFLYAASGLLAPWYGVVLLLAIWLALFVVACRWWTLHPRRTLLVPLVALAVWFGVLTGGEALFGWSA